VTIKAICFDADGVVVNPQMQFSKHLEKEYGISPVMMESFFRDAFNDCLAGRVNLEDVLPVFLADWGWKGSTREFINTWLSTENVVDHRVTNLVENLRHNGVICCLATNQEKNRAKYMKAEMGFADMFDHLFFSCELGLQKPHHAYYQYIERTLDLRKNAILFWDDSRKNVESAREFGWDAEIYTDFNQFEEKLKEYVLVEKRA
jgi:putative hydrolase of the HAD superfamily